MIRRALSLWNLLGVLALAVGLWAFWASSNTVVNNAVNLPSEAQKAKPGPKALHLYFADPRGEKFLVETRMVEMETDEEAHNRALAELLKGPQVQGANPVVPPGLPVPTVFLRDNLAYVDLPAAYGRLGLGTTGEVMLVYGIAYTLLDFPDVQGVRFLLAGKEIDSLGHLSLLEPIRRP
ncbi:MULTISPECIES: GerMN domain-containing protein [unclassified Meiothermus]|uniref:GerMN domain-containing protein n=1 Tax=unclassified Meiothermus TaxID=370471 RepID=UPI000D7BDDE5|nr:MULTISPECIES: GerMN domain-containing protein [unclassified Meiothermus]PZA06913.1 hypothetical protein DNA98_09545 [Meiothermus sp. Pnk-1]RYM38308.1 hypothetical protein EWH23_04670 [Meiothermus sp. PNK-Is4]